VTPLTWGGLLLFAILAGRVAAWLAGWRPRGRRPLGPELLAQIMAPTGHPGEYAVAYLLPGSVTHGEVLCVGERCGRPLYRGKIDDCTKFVRIYNGELRRMRRDH
jgi:hypothetical protein